MESSINSPALSLLMKHLAIGQRLKTHNFSAFHWSPRGSLVSIGQHFVATRVVHLPKSTETSLITESDQNGPDHQLLQLCTDTTAWSDLDQAVRAVHSCNSWFSILFYPITLEGRSCTTDDFVTIHFHLFLSSAVLAEPAKSIHLTQSLPISSSIYFFFFFPFSVPCKLVFANPEDLETWPNRIGIHFLIRVRSSYSPMAA